MSRGIKAEFEYEFEWFEEVWDEATEYYDEIPKSCYLGIEVDSNYNFDIVYSEGDEIPKDYEWLLESRLEKYFSEMLSWDNDLYETYREDYMI